MVGTPEGGDTEHGERRFGPGSGAFCNSPGVQHPPMHPCIHSPMHRHMYTATWLTLCYGWRVGIVQANVIVTATAAPDCDLTLPYLTLPYLTLPYLKLS